MVAFRIQMLICSIFHVNLQYIRSPDGPGLVVCKTIPEMTRFCLFHARKIDSPGQGRSGLHSIRKSLNIYIRRRTPRERTPTTCILKIEIVSIQTQAPWRCRYIYIIYHLYRFNICLYPRVRECYIL